MVPGRWGSSMDTTLSTTTTKRNPEREAPQTPTRRRPILDNYTDPLSLNYPSDFDDRQGSNLAHPSIASSYARACECSIPQSFDIGMVLSSIEISTARWVLDQSDNDGDVFPKSSDQFILRRCGFSIPVHLWVFSCEVLSSYVLRNNFTISVSGVHPAQLKLPEPH